MTRTVEDLRRTLESHSRELPLSEPRTVAVHRRIRRLRRQRATAGAAALVAIAVVGTLTVQATTRPADQAGSKGVAEYAAGGRLAAVMNIDTRTAVSTSTVVTPTSTSLILLTHDCAGEAVGGDVDVEFLVDGRDIGGGTCAGSVTTPVAAGRPVTVEFRLRHGITHPPRFVTDAERTSLPRLREHGGVYLPVPRSQYVFPPRPAHLESLSHIGKPGTELLQGRPTSVATTVDISRGLELEIDAVEPGVVTAELDGKVIGTAPTWAYGVQTSILDQTLEDLAKLGITGAHAQLTLHESGFADPAGAWKAVVGSG